MTSAVKLAPVIVQIQSSDGEFIPPNGKTDKTDVSVFGTALADGRVELFNNNSLVGTGIVNSQGQWHFVVARLVLGAHAFLAKSAGESSATYAITVVAPK
jgi:hypothetical protein